MEISPKATTRVEAYKGYNSLDRVRSSIDIIQDRLAKGLLDKDQILERLTEQMRLELEDDEDPSALQNITELFASLQDASGNLEQAKMDQYFRGVLGTIGISGLAGASNVLVKIFNWHAAYPFSMQFSERHGASPVIDEAAFTRAVAMLILEPQVSGSPQLTEPAVHGVSTNLDDPEFSISFITHRGRDATDYRRWLFRSLSVPKQACVYSCLPPVQLTVPRLVLTPQNQRNIDIDPSDSRIWYLTMEDERYTDLLDVLADTMPGCRKPFPNPTRDACELALSGLPEYELGLKELYVPSNILSTLIQVIIALIPASSSSLAALASEECNLSWEDFDRNLGTDCCTVYIASGLSLIYMDMKMPRL